MRGQHRRDRLPDPDHEPPPDGEQLTARPADRDMTVSELRDFIAGIELAAIRAGTDAGPLRPGAVIRRGGGIRSIWIHLPRSPESPVHHPDR